MSKNYGNEVVGEVSSRLFPIVMSSRPLMSFFAVVSVGFFLVVAMRDALSALTSSAERFDAYMQLSDSLPIIVMLLLPALFGTPIVAMLTRNIWKTSFRRTKVLASLLALTGLWVMQVSLSNGSQIWSQLAYHKNSANKGKSLLLSQRCPVEVAKPDFALIAHDPKSPYALLRCESYLSPAEVEDVCWREFQAVKPIKWSICGWKRKEMTGLNWPIANPVIIPGQPRETFATEAQMRAVLAGKGLSPL